jgi:hypothetical protein
VLTSISRLMPLASQPARILLSTVGTRSRRWFSIIFGANKDEELLYLLGKQVVQCRCRGPDRLRRIGLGCHVDTRADTYLSASHRSLLFSQLNTTDSTLLASHYTVPLLSHTEIEDP